MKTYKNKKTVYNRSPRDNENTYTIFNSKILYLPADEQLIMIHILSNNDQWVLNRIEIQERLRKCGFGKRRFGKAWMNLEKKKYLLKKRFQSGVEWTVNENPHNESIKSNPPQPQISNIEIKPTNIISKQPKQNIICFDTLNEIQIQRLKDSLRLYPDAPLQFQYDISKEEIRKRLNI